jgi:hypothetical protein
VLLLTRKATRSPLKKLPQLAMFLTYLMTPKFINGLVLDLVNKSSIDYKNL